MQALSGCPPPPPPPPHTHTHTHTETLMLSKMFKDEQQDLLPPIIPSMLEILSNLNWPTLTRCRNDQKATMLFKIITHQIDINAENLLIPNPDIYHTRGHNKRCMLPMIQINSYKYSFSPSVLLKFGIPYPNT